MTVWPSLISLSHKCDPRKPAPPVISDVGIRESKKYSVPKGSKLKNTIKAWLLKPQVAQKFFFYAQYDKSERFSLCTNLCLRPALHLHRLFFALLSPHRRAVEVRGDWRLKNHESVVRPVTATRHRWKHARAPQHQTLGGHRVSGIRAPQLLIKSYQLLIKSCQLLIVCSTLKCGFLSFYLQGMMILNFITLMIEFVCFCFAWF